MPERVLLVHNTYQLRGGEDGVVEAEAALLRGHGHEVQIYRRSNDELNEVGRLRAGIETLWSTRTTRDVTALFDAFRPDVVHVHNTFPRISPSLYWTAAKRQVPVVQTLHNFRLLCPQAMLLREGVVCEDCVGRLPWRAVVHRCYRGSAAQSAVLATMLSVHRSIGTYDRKVSRYIALTDFAREVLVRGGLPAERISVKPNFVAEPPPAGPVERRGLLYVGRLSEEKGIATLARAAALLPPGEMLEVVGEGPLQGLLEGLPNVRCAGWCSADEVARRMQSSRALVMPSLWYEGFPRTLVEAYACGLPVIASRIGNLAALIDDGRNGLLFEPGNADDLARVIAEALADPPRLAALGAAARATYEAHYTPERNLAQLRAIYARARVPLTSPG